MDLKVSLDTSVLIGGFAFIFFILFLIYEIRRHSHASGGQHVEQHIGTLNVHYTLPGEKSPLMGNKHEETDAKSKTQNDHDHEYVDDLIHEMPVKMEQRANSENDAAILRRRKTGMKKSESYPKTQSSQQMPHQRKTYPDLLKETGHADDFGSESDERVEADNAEDEGSVTHKAFFDNISTQKTENNAVREVGEQNSQKRKGSSRKKPGFNACTETITLDNPAESLQRPASLSSDVTEYVKVPEYKAESPSEAYTFTVDEKGCNVSSQYCKINIPPGATTKVHQITMKPVYKMKESFDGKAFISPFVKFSSDSEVAFRKDVRVSLQTGYTAVKKEIVVKVWWKRDAKSGYELHEQVKHGKDRFIHFTCRHFCGYGCTADQSQFQNMRRHYYFAGYVRDPKRGTTRIFHWMVLDDCPQMLDHTRKFLENRETIIDPEIFSVSYNFNLQLRVDENDVIVSCNDARLDLVKNWGSPFNTSRQFKLENNQGGQDSQVRYKILAIHATSHAVVDIKQNHFYMEWVLPSVNQHNINVYDSATGIRVDRTVRSPYQQQTSVASNISDASSGYNSDMPSPSHERLRSQVSLLETRADDVMDFQRAVAQEMADEGLGLDSTFAKRPSLLDDLGHSRSFSAPTTPIRPQVMAESGHGRVQSTPARCEGQLEDRELSLVDSLANLSTAQQEHQLEVEDVSTMEDMEDETTPKNLPAVVSLSEPQAHSTPRGSRVMAESQPKHQSRSSKNEKSFSG